MSNKPDWKDAPSWAMWLTADTTLLGGMQEFWVFFEHEPFYDRGGWMLSKDSGGRWLQTEHKTEPGFDFENSLEPRP